jgi:hypothetical protein
MPVSSMAFWRILSPMGPARNSSTTSTLGNRYGMLIGL